MRVAALMPALDEEASLPIVLAGLADRGLDRIVVVDNGSMDRTAEVAAAAGAVVVFCGHRGYGSACLAGLDRLALDPPDVVVFLDADGADDPADLPALLEPLRDDRVELVIGSRVTGNADTGALTPVQRFGNALSCRLMALVWGARFTDLGPMRAVRWGTLERLQMSDPDFGWTVEMQSRAARLGMGWVEVPVRYRRRVAGRSKIAGTVKGSFKAGAKILFTIGREFVRGRP